MKKPQKLCISSSQNLADTFWSVVFYNPSSFFVDFDLFLKFSIKSKLWNFTFFIYLLSWVKIGLFIDKVLAEFRIRTPPLPNLHFILQQKKYLVLEKHNFYASQHNMVMKQFFLRKKIDLYRMTHQSCIHFKKNPNVAIKRDFFILNKI